MNCHPILYITNFPFTLLIYRPMCCLDSTTFCVKGHLWDGSELCWRHNPNHYGAIHFHDDDVYDFSWDTDLEWTIPVCIPSGVYIIRLRNENGDEDALPLFICPPKNDRMTKKLCILIPTFTYGEYN